MTSVGSAARDAVEVSQSQHKQSITSDSSSALDQGAELRRNVQTEQNKGVVRRLGAKGIIEAKSLIPGSGEAQQK